MKSEATKGKVLVTGISGFLALQISKYLLESNYSVRGTVRNKSNTSKLTPVKALPFQEHLEIYEADLLDPQSIDNAVKGCSYVMHVAAPVLIEGTEEETVKPAVEGTKAVFNSSVKHGIKAIIMTSSIAAIIDYETDQLLDETCWPDLSHDQPSYIKAKSLSEEAAWEIVNAAPEETRPRLVVINPGYIMGPTMTLTSFHSGNFVRGLLNGTLKDIPKVYYGIADVRDVALAHVKALENSELKEERLICYDGECMWLEEVAKIVKDEFEKYGYKIDAKVQEECPSKDKNNIFNVRWGKNYKLSNEKIKKVLGMEFRSAKESIIDMGYSLIKQGLVPDLTKK